MSKTVYFYNFNIFSFDNNTQQIIPINRARNQLNRFINGLPYRDRQNEQEAAAALDEIVNELEQDDEEVNERIHLFSNRAENGDIFLEVINVTEEHVFGLIGKNIDTYLHLRNRNTRRSREIAREEGEQIEATTFFVVNLENMVCAFFREQGAPQIEEMDKLFYRVRGFENYQVNMAKMTNAEVLDSIARKDIISTLEYQIQVPHDTFFAHIDIDRDDALRIRNQGTTKLVLKIASAGRDQSLLQDSEYEEKVGFFTRLGERIRVVDNHAKGRAGVKDDGERKAEYSFLDDNITLKTTRNINYTEVAQMHSLEPERPYTEVLFEYFEEQLIIALEELN